uniref:KIB1-4 beta-propeller domain-containing protein n=1 Tax=Oryza punctata TaxID=4537 RepID=A0A0E0LMH0_ORYPU
MGIMTPETTTSSDQPPRMLTAVDMMINPPFSFCSMSDSLHLVDNGGGELILVYRTIRRVRDDYDYYDEFGREYAVYRVDLDSRLLIPMRSLSGRAVFIGLSRSVSVSPNTFPSVTGDTVYLGFDCKEKTEPEKIGGYHVGDGSIEPSQLIKRASRLNPSTLVDCLSWCIQSNGKQLFGDSGQLERSPAFQVPSPNHVKQHQAPMKHRTIKTERLAPTGAPLLDSASSLSWPLFCYRPNEDTAISDPARPPLPQRSVPARIQLAAGT